MLGSSLHELKGEVMNSTINKTQEQTSTLQKVLPHELAIALENVLRTSIGFVQILEKGYITEMRAARTAWDTIGPHKELKELKEDMERIGIKQNKMFDTWHKISQTRTFIQELRIDLKADFMAEQELEAAEEMRTVLESVDVPNKMQDVVKEWFKKEEMWKTAREDLLVLQSGDKVQTIGRVIRLDEAPENEINVEKAAEEYARINMEKAAWELAWAACS